jgi:pilus assembly protein CpaF
LEPLLHDRAVSDILVNGYNKVYIERHGKLEKVDIQFQNDEHLMQIIDRIVSRIGRHIDEASPMVDARLPDGSRVNAIVPPLAIDGPVLSIRRFGTIQISAEELIRRRSMTEAMVYVLEGCVKARMNILISGGTGAGKTTLLNVLSASIPSDERIVTIEDSAELQLQQPHVVRLETRPPNIEGKGEVTQRDLVRNALRMRPDRIVVGEVRSGEAIDMLQAMNTGHDGSLSTVHSNSPRDTISRLETMSLMAGMDLPIRVISKQIASAVQLIVHQARFSDGSRKVTHVTEVQGMEGDTLLLSDIFLFYQEGVDSDGRVLGYHGATGIRPKCVPQLETAGCKLPRDLFLSKSKTRTI